MNKKGIFAAVTTLLILGLAALPAQAAIPENFDISNNYYTVYGGPDLSATLLGDNEFSRGDTVTLSIEMMNKGAISGFKSEDEADDGKETVLQKTEMQYEAQTVTAIGILATLTSDDPNIKVKSGSQEAGTLKQGKDSSSPTKFTIEISKNAPAGTYPLTLDLSYKYQNNVQVGGDDIDTTTGLVTNHEVGIWYENTTQTQTLEVKVKKEPYFEVTEVEGNLYPDEGGMLYVTYKNTGEEPAKDATVRVSAGDPFSTTDDQAYLGTLNPGESSVAVFDMDVDEDANPKPYSLNSEILYEDTDGHDQISDSVKINTEVLSAEKSLPGYQIGAGIGFIALAACFVLYRKKQQE
ncbi:NPCBM-associated, NEW3 domain of alpha-galactosidase [Methanosarcina sp. MTP4]|uniref:COG1361 S-layer family protein n=1 Tax=Methanosarcina sp. MTP4 TaxID=1434100 RepID=UPI000615CC47|nr:COG1361 S-layer family protein [Methanosarcina sp. MTP4]AKB26479.1 NPCBM-associated, NEW3 domain of alpha-galactosidase [Methanosarcina sp. MTP4]